MSTIYSFIVDVDQRFFEMGWYLAQSLIQHCAALPDQVHIHVTANVPKEITEVFHDQGFSIHKIDRYLDGKWANKLQQLPVLLKEVTDLASIDRIVLLDTDTMVIDDLRPFLTQKIQAKVVDCANPSLECLIDIFREAQIDLKEISRVQVDATDEYTLSTNCNGGFYSIPTALAAEFSNLWRLSAEWLSAPDRLQFLARANKTQHLDQVSACIALSRMIQHFENAPSNINFFTHMNGLHRYLDNSRPIALLHYHQLHDGQLLTRSDSSSLERKVIEMANAQIQSYSLSKLTRRMFRGDTTIDSNSFLFITLDSCRFDTFEQAHAPNMKSIAPLHKANSPSYFTYPSHQAYFMGFGPGVATEKQSYLNPKFGKIFKLTGTSFGESFLNIPSGQNIVDGLNRMGYTTIGSGGVSWFDTSSETGKVLSRDFQHFFYPGNYFYLEKQLQWISQQILHADPHKPLFVFLNVGETHAPYWHNGASWNPQDNPCMPFNPHGTNNAQLCKERQIKCLEYVDSKLKDLINQFLNIGSILLCSDHGDAHGEDDLWEHGFFHETTTTVPLLINLKGRRI